MSKDEIVEILASYEEEEKPFTIRPIQLVHEDIEFLTNRLNYLKDKLERVDNIIANLLKH